jgi:hypothetical protein
VLRANQRDDCAALIKATAEAIIELACDRRYVGGTVGVVPVLHTWKPALSKRSGGVYRERRAIGISS